MAKDFRNEIFKICNDLITNREAKDIAALIKNMSFNVNSEKVYADFAQIARHYNNQFHGYLFVDENAEELSNSSILNVKKLSEDDRKLLERGHRTLKRFVECCLQEIRNQSALFSMILDPYFEFKEVKCEDTIKPLVSDEEWSGAVSAFTNGTIYKLLKYTNAFYLFDKIDVSTIRALLDKIKSEIEKSFNYNLSSEIRDFSLRSINGFHETPEVLMAIMILVFALRESLKMACQLLYQAICGGELIVLNDDNMIAIENEENNIVCETKKVLLQGIIANIPVDNYIGSVLLIDCHPNDIKHIHEFNMITGVTINYACDMGMSTKLSLVKVDEELINIHNLTQSIIKIGLPKQNYNE